MTTVNQILQDCHFDDLIRMAWFLKEHEHCTFIVPEEDSELEWIQAIERAALQRRNNNDLQNYLTRIKNIVQANIGIRDYTHIRFDIEDDSDLTGEEIYDNDYDYVYNDFEDEDNGQEVTGIQDEDNGQDVTGIYEEDVVKTQTLKVIVDEEVTDDTRVLECKICTINKICMVLARCGHTFCYSCTTRFENKCATCRTPFTDETKIHMYI
jgi:hypothetical protein